VHRAAGKAYEALFLRHDALKGAFQRDRKTSLDIQDFARIFAAFCLQTYDVRKFEFSRTDARNYIGKAKDYVRLDVVDEDYLEDCLQAVCLLMDDGLNVVFSHRSFQEYFVAQHISGADPLVQRDLLDRFIESIQVDSVYDLLYEMNPGLVERELLIPKLRRAFDEMGVKKFVGITHFTRFLKKNFTRLRVSRSGFGVMRRGRRGPLPDVVAFAYRHCVPPGQKTAMTRRQREGFAAKHGVVGRSGKRTVREGRIGAVYDLQRLSINAPVIRDLAEQAGGLLSINGLNAVLRVSRELEHKHARVRNSLDQLLK